MELARQHLRALGEAAQLQSRHPEVAQGQDWFSSHLLHCPSAAQKTTAWGTSTINTLRNHSGHWQRSGLNLQPHNCDDATKFCNATTLIRAGRWSVSRQHQGSQSKAAELEFGPSERMWWHCRSFTCFGPAVPPVASEYLCEQWKWPKNLETEELSKKYV
jgi:hypothetical protein